MKKGHLIFSIAFLLVTLIFIACQENKSKKTTPVKEEKAIITEDTVSFVDNKLEKVIFNQTIQSIVDSLDYKIKINLSNDYYKYKTIYVADTLHHSFIDSKGILTRNNSKLEVFNKKLKGGKELKLVSSYKEYCDYVSQNRTSRVILTFSRMYFSNKNEEAIFSFWFSCQENTGAEYTVHVKNINGRWIQTRYYESAIR